MSSEVNLPQEQDELACGNRRGKRNVVQWKWIFCLLTIEAYGKFCLNIYFKNRKVTHKAFDF